ncbi:Integrator complex subunit 11-like protein [Diplonema papillatum]|nr:Integrator complex subunit 11-like protein [Diplonema papillatum]
MADESRPITITPLGAGKEVGRSCVLVGVGDALIMCDCGMHMGYKNYKMFPDFAAVAEGDLTGKIDAVLITHFHLDHVGSLPFFTEQVGYSGPVVMTAPTHAMAPLLLDDMRNVASKTPDGNEVFSREDVRKAMEKSVIIGERETVELPGGKGIRITAFYAGHVLGACMFLIEANGASVLYTGDYNTSSDRHLLGARVPPGLRPDVVISESTYGSTIRDSKRHRERDFLTLVHSTLVGGGKVLIPVFAMGRAQELLILLETFFKRLQLTFPVYFSAGMVGRANDYYKLFTSWTSPAIKSKLSSSFDFPDVRVFDKTLLNSTEPLVLFSTPGMLHAGASLQAFKVWCTDPRNAVILPGFCVEGTVGHQVLTQVDPVVTIDRSPYHVRCKVVNMPFSAHADARGVLKLVQQTSPQHVCLVHGNYLEAMLPLKKKLKLEMPRLTVSTPANGECVKVALRQAIPVGVNASLVPVVPSEALGAARELSGFVQECLQQLKGPPDDAALLAIEEEAEEEAENRAGEEAGRAAGKRPKKRSSVPPSSAAWWVRWGVSVADARASGPSDADCGCDMEWDRSLRRVLQETGPDRKYLPIADGFDDWGTEELIKLVVTVPSAESVDYTVKAEDAEEWFEEKKLARTDVLFRASIPRRDPPVPAPENSEALLASLQRCLTSCIPSTTFVASDDSVTYRSVRATATSTEYILEWEYEDMAVALRAHSTIFSTVGVAL